MLLISDEERSCSDFSSDHFKIAMLKAVYSSPDLVHMKLQATGEFTPVPTGEPRCCPPFPMEEADALIHISKSEERTEQ